MHYHFNVNWPDDALADASVEIADPQEGMPVVVLGWLADAL